MLQAAREARAARAGQSKREREAVRTERSTSGQADTKTSVAQEDDMLKVLPATLLPLVALVSMLPSFGIQD